MSVWNLGSVATHIGAMVSWNQIPTSISGTTLNNMISQEINFVEKYITITIDDAAILEEYQPPIIDLTLSKLLTMIEVQEGGVDEVKFGELTVSSSSKGGNAALAKSLRQDAIIRLKELQRKVRMTRVNA